MIKPRTEAGEALRRRLQVPRTLWDLTPEQAEACRAIEAQLDELGAKNWQHRCQGLGDLHFPRAGDALIKIWAVATDRAVARIHSVPGRVRPWTATALTTGTYPSPPEGWSK